MGGECEREEALFLSSILPFSQPPPPFRRERPREKKQRSREGEKGSERERTILCSIVREEEGGKEVEVGSPTKVLYSILRSGILLYYVRAHNTAAV